jgi:hypothetical protein
VPGRPESGPGAHRSGLVRHEVEHTPKDDEDGAGNAAPDAPRHDQGAKDTPRGGQNYEGTDHSRHDLNGHALAWHGHKRLGSSAGWCAFTDLKRSDMQGTPRSTSESSGR